MRLSRYWGNTIIAPSKSKGWLLAIVILGSLQMAWADFDVNSIAGYVIVDGGPAPSGMLISFTEAAAGIGVTSTVDGPNLPPFVWGGGRYDTGDIPQFDSGDIVVIESAEAGYFGAAQVVLVGGTTMVNLTLTTFAENPQESGEGEAEGEDSAGDASDDELGSIKTENEALRAEIERLRARLDECEAASRPLDYLASLDRQNLSTGAADGIAQAVYYLVEEAYWGMDYAARTMGTRTIGVLDQMENVSNGVWDAGGSLLDSFLGFLPVLTDGRVLGVIAVVMASGFGLTVFVVGRDARRRFRQRLESMRERGIIANEQPFWDDTEV